MTQGKINIIDDVGGQSVFNFVVMNYCESIREDPTIKHFFAKVDLKGLIVLQTDILKVAFMDASPQETEAAMGRLAVNYQIGQLGLNETHFEAMKAHFLLALRHSWVEESLVQMIDTQYNILLPLFQQSSKSVRPSIAQRPTPLSKNTHAGHHQRM
ncbi:unnamed protein product [Cylindrotheca closterium]|uniref:Uncharacterized protein n=1 Tax=Cylindrotheca closterium TaxID=2856 RepID=A0AAD2CP72_9STRA|nr:unnamed protein product [Cylindrotheca closterium]